MSRSYRHSPVTGLCCCRSEKEDRSLANRCLRRKVVQWVVSEGRERVPFPVLREVSDPWNWGRDGYQSHWVHVHWQWPGWGQDRCYWCGSHWWRAWGK